jgi:hypothetical protein
MAPAETRAEELARHVDASAGEMTACALRAGSAHYRSTEYQQAMAAYGAAYRRMLADLAELVRLADTAATP